MKKLTTTLVSLALILTLGTAFAHQHEDVIGTLYTRDTSGSINMTCTASLVDPLDFSLEYAAAHDVLLLTAAHCVDRGLRENDDETWSTTRDYVVSFDERSYYTVELLRLGRADRGYDIALMYFTEFAPEAQGLRLGDWSTVRPGTSILNWANPLGLGIQAFQGYVTMLSLDRPIEGTNIFWRGNAVAIVPSAGGSSGSLVLNEDHEVIGVHIGAVVPRSGSSFAVFVPLPKFERFISDDSIARDITY